jgi:prophage regulatory protein
LDITDAKGKKKAVVTMRPLYLDLDGVAEALSLSKTTVQKMVRTNEFPRPRALSGRRVGWLVREIEEWAEARPLSDMLPPPSGRD